jgi:hypothetical protein
MEERKDVVIRPPAASAIASVSAPRILMSVPLWIYWWRIAEERADAADKDALAGDGMEASMVAILASASALEGMRGSLGQHTDCQLPKFARATRQEAKIMETLKRCFVACRQMQDWKEPLDWLFELRDPVVHSEEKLREGVISPDNPNLMVPVESRDYSPASAKKAVGLVREIVGACIEKPKPCAEAWCEWRREVVQRILADPLRAEFS